MSSFFFIKHRAICNHKHSVRQITVGTLVSMAHDVLCYLSDTIKRNQPIIWGIFVTNILLYHTHCIEESASHPFFHSSLWNVLWLGKAFGGFPLLGKDDVQTRRVEFTTCHPASVVQGHILCIVCLQQNPKNIRWWEKKLNLSCIIFISACEIGVSPQWAILETISFILDELPSYFLFCFEFLVE